MPDTVRIAMWSGPRNISTAMMRAWESRADATVMDEPFYGAYLATTGLAHPMAAEIMDRHPTDWHGIARDCASRAGSGIIYQKHMCQHMVPDAPLDWMGSVAHAFLIRPPAEVAASFDAKMDSWEAGDIGFRRQAELFDHVCQVRGAAPPVIEARDVLENPEGMLRALCSALGVAFDPAMLSWAPGRRDSDGVWAQHWYKAVEGSTGFAPPKPPGPVPKALRAIVEESQPWYDRLARHRMRA